MVLRSVHIKSQQILQENRLQREILRTLVLLLMFILAGAGMVIGQIVSDRLFDRYVRRVNVTESLAVTAQQVGGSDNPGQYAMEPLRDILFQVLPDWSDKRGWLPDALLLPLVVLCLLFCVLWRHNRVVRYQGWIVLRRFLLILSALYLFRTVTFIVTTVPSPVNDCLPMYIHRDDPDVIHKYLVLFGRMASGKMTACTDNIYSGHTTLITVSVWMFFQYSGHISFKMYALTHASIALLSILITRLHYTVDVIVAMIIASFVYVSTHYLIQLAMDDLYLPKSNYHSEIIEAVDKEKNFLRRITSPTILNVVRWFDGMDIRLRKHGPQSERP